MQRREAVILGLVNGGTEGEIGQDESYGAHVAPKGCMVEGIEAVVIGNGVVSLELQQKLNNVVTLLGYGIMKGRVTLRILGHVCIIISVWCHDVGYKWKDRHTHGVILMIYNPICDLACAKCIKQFQGRGT